MSTKINATVDALGNPIGFALTPGQACDLDGADILLPQIEAGIVIAHDGAVVHPATAALLDKGAQK